jgi:transposase-like protein
MKKNNHDHYVSDEELENIVVEMKLKGICQWRCPECGKTFDLPVKIVYDTDINERKE